MIRLDEGLYTWGYFNEEKQYNFNGFLVYSQGACVVVDPPPLAENDEGYFKVLCVNPALVVVTNRNHMRSRERFTGGGRVPTGMHKDELSQVDVKVERVLEDGQTLPGGLVVVHLPGKSPGEIALFWPERKALIVGDALIAPGGKLKLIPEAKLDDPKLLRKSLQRLRELDFDALLVADGDPILRGAKSRVVAFLDGLEAR